MSENAPKWQKVNTKHGTELLVASVLSGQIWKSLRFEGSVKLLSLLYYFKVHFWSKMVCIPSYYSALSAKENVL